MKANLLFIVGVLFFMSACTEVQSDEFCQNPNASCPDDSQIEATSCCTDSDCYWLYNGNRYNCDGDDCNAVITTIINNACINSSANINLDNGDLESLKAQMQELTSQLLLDARAASGCCDF